VHNRSLIDFQLEHDLSNEDIERYWRILRLVHSWLPVSYNVAEDFHAELGPVLTGHVTLGFKKSTEGDYRFAYLSTDEIRRLIKDSRIASDVVIVESPVIIWCENANTALINILYLPYPDPSTEHLQWRRDDWFAKINERSCGRAYTIEKEKNGKQSRWVVVQKSFTFTATDTSRDQSRWYIEFDEVEIPCNYLIQDIEYLEELGLGNVMANPEN